MSRNEIPELLAHNFNNFNGYTGCPKKSVTVSVNPGPIDMKSRSGSHLDWDRIDRNCKGSLQIKNDGKRPSLAQTPLFWKLAANEFLLLYFFCSMSTVYSLQSPPPQ